MTQPPILKVILSSGALSEVDHLSTDPNSTESAFIGGDLDGNEQQPIIAGSKRRRVILDEDDDMDTAMEIESDVLVPTSVNGRDVISTPALQKDVFSGESATLTAEAVEINTATVPGISQSAPTPPNSPMNDVPVSEADYDEMATARVSFQIREPLAGVTSSATLRPGAAFHTFFSPGLVYEGKVTRTTATGARYYEPDTDKPVHVGRPMQNLLNALAKGVRMFYHYPSVVVQRVSPKGKPVGKGVQIGVLDIDQLNESLALNNMTTPAFAYRARVEPDELRNTSRIVQRMAPLFTTKDLEAVFRDTASNFGLRNPVIFVHSDESGRETMPVPDKALRVYSETDLSNAEDALVGGLIDDNNPVSKATTKKAIKKMRAMKEQLVSSPVVAHQRGLDVLSAIDQVIMDTRAAVDRATYPSGPEARALRNVIDSLSQISDAIRKEAQAQEMHTEQEETLMQKRKQSELDERLQLLRYRRVMAEKKMKSRTAAPRMADVRKAVLNELRESLSPGARAVFVMPESVIDAVSKLRLNWSGVQKEAEARLVSLQQRAGPSPTKKEAEDTAMFEKVLSVIRVGLAEKSDDTALKGVYDAVRKRPDLFSAMSPTIDVPAISLLVAQFFDDPSAREYLPKDPSVKNTATAVRDSALLALAFSEDVDDREMAALDAEKEAAEATQATVSRSRTKSVRSVMTGRSLTSDGRAARNQGVPVAFLMFGAYEAPADEQVAIDEGTPQVKSFQFPMQKDVTWENIVDANGTQMFRQGSLFYPAKLEEAVGSAEPDAPSSWQLSASAVLRALRPVNNPLSTVQEVQAALRPRKDGEAETAAFFVSSPYVFHKMEMSSGKDGRRSTGTTTAYYAIQYSDMAEFPEIGVQDNVLRWQLFWYNPRSKPTEDFDVYGKAVVWGSHYPLVSERDFLLWRSVVGTAALKAVRIPPKLQTRDEKNMMALARQAAEDEERAEEAPPPMF